VDQSATITDDNERVHLGRKMTRLSNKVRIADRSREWLRETIKRLTQILRRSLERYYVLRIINQSLSALNNLTELQEDVIYQHQWLD